jgi:pantoate--beta-alanine ligase
MKIIKSPQQMQKAVLSLKRKGKTVGLVPTMGALHEGHLSLIKRARKENDIVVVSIFVNPSQFGPNEDYLRYPRPFKKDAALCRKAGVDYIFAPVPKDMYTDGYQTCINVADMSQLMCGKFRTVHFKGVATVVAKLFNIAAPDRAYFGMKDFQQLKIIERMVKDLNIPVRVVPCPIVREKEGLALSSRNQYLSQREHDDSLTISKALREAAAAAGKEKNAEKIKRLVSDRIKTIKNARIDYVVVSDPESLEELIVIKGPFVIAAAVWVGKTRLIDNILVNTKR